MVNRDRDAEVRLIVTKRILAKRMEAKRQDQLSLVLSAEIRSGDADRRATKKLIRSKRKKR